MEKIRMKVCFVMPDKFPVPAVKGGAIETLVETLIENHDSDMDITVCSVYDQQAEEKVNNKRYKNVKFYWTYTSAAWKYVSDILYRAIRKITKSRILFFAPHYFQIAKLLRREKFDFIIVEGGDYACVLDITKQNYSPEKMIIHVHHHYLPDKYVANGYGIMIGVSQFVVDEYYKKCSEINLKKYVLRNCIDIPKFSKDVTEKQKLELRNKLGFKEEDYIVIFVGRILKVKGIHELIKAILKIQDTKVKLLIIGSPNFSEKKSTPYLQEVQYMVRENSDRIVFSGYIPNEKLYQYYKVGNLLCVPSMCEEAAGLVVLEGMAAGLPTIITKSGGMVEYVTEQTSVIVDREGLCENLTDIIRKLKSTPKITQSMTELSKQHVQQYSAEAYGRNFVYLMRRIGRGDT